MEGSTVMQNEDRAGMVATAFVLAGLTILSWIVVLVLVYVLMLL